MCLDATASMVLQGVGMIGQYQAAKAQGEALKQQYYAQAAAQRLEASRLRLNAKTSIAQADDSSARSLEDQRDLLNNIDKLNGTQKAAAAASGVSAGAGSALWDQQSSVMEGYQAKQTIQMNYMKERWSFLQRAQDYDFNASMTDWAAANNVAAGDYAKKASDQAALMNLLGNIGNLGMEWYQYKNQKAGGGSSNTQYKFKTKIGG